MKMITAIIRPECLDMVQSSLEKRGWTKMTVTPVRGRGEQGGMHFLARGKSYDVNLLEKVMITIVALEKNVDKIIEGIIEGARTDRGLGDGKIFITECTKSIRIKDGIEITEENPINGY